MSPLMTWAARNASEPQPLRPVGGAGDVGLPDFRLLEANWRSQANADFVVEILGEIFRRGVQFIEWWKIVDETVIEIIDHRMNQLLHFDEIHKQADSIKLCAFHRQLDAVIVAVHVFTLAAITAQGVSGGESL